MLGRQNIKGYFMGYDVTREDFEKLHEEMVREGFAPDVEPELQVAFIGYCTAESGAAVVPFTVECRRLLGLPI